ncbi:MAG: cytochrome c [Bacteroidota bacterium]
MKQLAILLLFVTFLFACGGEEEKTPTRSTSTTAAAAKPKIDAKKIWKIRCIACHGLYGNQGLNGAANLQEVTISLEERINIITNGKQGEKGVMTAFGEILSEAEIKAVAEYTMTFNKDL